MLGIQYIMKTQMRKYVVYYKELDKDDESHITIRATSEQHAYDIFERNYSEGLKFPMITDIHLIEQP